MPDTPTLEPYAEFFARIWNLDISCPACGCLHLESSIRGWWRKRPKSLRAAWDPLMSHFTCRDCGAHFVLGVVAWKPPVTSKRVPPLDHIPKPWHLARIRELLGPGGFLKDYQERLHFRDPANLVVTSACTCTFDEDAGTLRKDGCPVHAKPTGPRARDRRRTDLAEKRSRVGKVLVKVRAKSYWRRPTGKRTAAAQSEVPVPKVQMETKTDEVEPEQ